MASRDDYIQMQLSAGAVHITSIRPEPYINGDGRMVDPSRITSGPGTRGHFLRFRVMQHFGRTM
jgi:hypothetical protein